MRGRDVLAGHPPAAGASAEAPAGEPDGASVAGASAGAPVAGASGGAPVARESAGVRVAGESAGVPAAGESGGAAVAGRPSGAAIAAGTAPGGGDAAAVPPMGRSEPVVLPDDVQDEVAQLTAGADLRHDELPLPDFDHQTVPQLRGRLRSLGLAELVQLRDYEQAHAARLPVLTLLDNRIAKLLADTGR